MSKENNSQGSLAGFKLTDDFNDQSDDTFFGQKVESSDQPKINEVKGQPSSNSGDRLPSSDLSSGGNPPGFEDDDEDDGITTFEDFGETPKAKKETPKTEAPKKTAPKEVVKESEEEIEEEEEEDGVSKLGEKAKPKTGEVVKEKAPVNEPEDDTLTDEEKDIKFFTQLAKENKERGILRFVEIKEDEKIDEERYFQLQAEDYEKALDEEFEAFIEELKGDQDASDFIQFKRNGGKTADFFKTYKPDFDIDSLDIVKNEKHKEKVIDYYLTNVEKLDEDDISDRKKWLKEGGREDKYVAKYYQAIKDADSTKKKTLIETQKEAEVSREEDSKRFRQDLLTSVEEDIMVGAIPIKKSEAREWTDYINKPMIKTKNGKFITQLQAKLVPLLTGKTKEDRQKLMALAKVIETDFKPEDLATTVKTAVVKRVKSKLAETRMNPNTRSSRSSTQREASLADSFGE